MKKRCEIAKKPCLVLNVLLKKNAALSHSFWNKKILKTGTLGITCQRWISRVSWRSKVLFFYSFQGRRQDFSRGMHNFFNPLPPFPFYKAPNLRWCCVRHLRDTKYLEQVVKFFVAHQSSLTYKLSEKARFISGFYLTPPRFFKVRTCVAFVQVATPLHSSSTVLIFFCRPDLLRGFTTLRLPSYFHYFVSQDHLACRKISISNASLMSFFMYGGYSWFFAFAQLRYVLWTASLLSPVIFGWLLLKRAAPKRIFY